jgi:hypothetical protein
MYQPQFKQEAEVFLQLLIAHIGAVHYLSLAGFT